MLSDLRVVLLEFPPAFGVFCAVCVLSSVFWPGSAGCVAAGGVCCCALDATACCGARLDAVPGAAGSTRVTPLVSSDFCELTITDLAGSKVSSLCSPLVMSMSADTPVRNLSTPSSGSSVLLIFAARSCSRACRYSSAATLAWSLSGSPARRDGCARFPLMSLPKLTRAKAFPPRSIPDW